MMIAMACGAMVALQGCASSGTAERAGLVTMKGNPLTLVGRPCGVGDRAPEWRAVASDMSVKAGAEFKGKTLVLCTLPSVDTPVCDKEAREFNARAAAMPGVSVVIVSRDLPFAQKRWCGASGATNVQLLSDARFGDVGRAMGVEIKENGLLARAVFVIDADGVVRYQQIVKEVASEPDYDAAMKAAAALK
jgi:thiol peroxidase